MHRLSLAILAVVILFVTGVTGILVLRGRSVRNETPEPPSTPADYRVKEVRIQERGSGDAEWKLEATLAEVFQQQGKTRMKNVTITILEPDRSWTVTGDEGELLDSTKSVSLRDNVVLVGSDGLRLETRSLQWLAKERRVWTDDPVTIFRDGAVIEGRGLEVSMGEERTSVKGRVRATFVASTRERKPARNAGESRSGPSRSPK